MFISVPVRVRNYTDVLHGCARREYRHITDMRGDKRVHATQSLLPAFTIFVRSNKQLD